jgi:hypothetical protein
MRLILFLLILAGPTALAQKITVRGQLRDSSAQALPSATVLLLNAKDSSLVNFALTNHEGFFELKNVARQEYLFKVSYMGYAPLIKAVSPSVDQTVVDLGALEMHPITRELAAITIESERAPVTIKKDTIEFNAGSFKTKENALVEDLLKNLPGVEVDNDGTIRAQGEQVQRVTVDGKTFFGNDPKLATRNLPADAIDKIQVFDKKSDQSVFTGIDDGQKEKTINLQLKEEKRKGAFGTLQGGYGSDERYQFRANLNRFRKDEQFSFLGMANNVNEQGFSIDDYMSFTGGAQRMRSGGSMRVQFNSNNQNGVPLNFGGRINGIISNYAGGLNFNKTFTPKTELSTSYFYNQIEHDLRQKTERINYRPSGDLFYNEMNKQNNTNINHRVNLMLDHKIDSMNSIKVTSAVTYNETETHESGVGENLSTEGDLENMTIRNTDAFGTSISVNANALWRHRFAKKGRTLTANAQMGISKNDRNGTQDAITEYYNSSQSVNETAQDNMQTTNNLGYATTLTYTEPLGRKKYLEGNYSYRQNLNDVDRDVYDRIEGALVFNPVLSNQYNSDYRYHRAGLNFRINRSKYNLVVGSSVQQTLLDGDLESLNASVSKTYQNVLPVARFNFDFSDTRHLEVEYETSVQEPTIQELQPVIDNSDPLNLYIGNPNLRPAYQHKGQVNYNSFNPANFVNFFSFVEATYTRNAITNAQSYTDRQERITTPVNVTDNKRITANATFGFPIEKISSRLSITGNTTHQLSANVIEGQATDITQTSIGGRTRYDYHYKEIFDFSLSAEISRQVTQYDFNEQADQQYINKTFSSEANLHFLKNYQLNGSFEYLIYQSTDDAYDQAIPFLNASLSRFFLKAKSGELRFSVNNILDQKTGISQNADINYFERQTSNSLGRYFMVSFIYALNKQLNPMAMRRRGGMIRIMR